MACSVPSIASSTSCKLSSPAASLHQSSDRKSGGLGDLNYPLIYDVTKSISPNILGIALRGLFIIDKEGIIQHSTINNLAIGRSVDETMRTLQVLQYVQDNPDERYVQQGGSQVKSQ